MTSNNPLFGLHRFNKLDELPLSSEPVTPGLSTVYYLPAVALHATYHTHSTVHFQTFLTKPSKHHFDTGLPRLKLRPAILSLFKLIAILVCPSKNLV